MSQPYPSADVIHERLAFSFHQTVPARRAGLPEPTFATIPSSEPRDWGYSGLVAFTAVLLFRPQDDVPALDALRLAEICAIAGIAPMLLHRLTKRLPVFRVTPESVALGLLAVTILATAPFSIWPGGVLSLFFETFLKLVIVFVLMINTLTTARRIEQITWLMVLAGGYVAARGVFDYARGVNLIEDGRLAGPISGIWGNPNDLSLNLICILPIAVVAALSRRYSVPWRALAGIFVLLMIATVLFTKSRGGLIGLGVVLLALIVASRRRAVIAIAVIAGTLIATPFLPDSFYNRMSTIFNDRADAIRFTGSREARVTVMTEGLMTFVERPLTGVGAGQFRNYNFPGREERWREAHNALIQVAADLGIFGLVLFAFLLYRAIRTAIWLRTVLAPPHRRRPSLGATLFNAEDRDRLHDHSVAMTASLLGWLTCAMFASVAYAWTIYYLIALTVAARELIRDRAVAVAAVGAASTQRSGRYSVRNQAEPAQG